MAEQHKMFDVFCRMCYGISNNNGQAGCSRSKTISAVQGQKVVILLKISLNYSYNLKHEAKQRGFGLTRKTKLRLKSRQWLTDKHIFAKQAVSHTQGLQPPYLEQKNQFTLTYANDNEWSTNTERKKQHLVCLSTLSSPSHTLNLYDSLKTKRSALTSLRRVVFCFVCKKVTIVCTVQVQWQCDGSGPFAVVNSTELCLDPHQAMLYTSSHL